MRMLNKPEVVTEVVKQPNKKPEQTKKIGKNWYRVALHFNPDTKLCYTVVIDRPHHQTMVESNHNFVRWEPAVEYSL